MPWCDSCDKYLNPNTVDDDGSCPWCGSKLAKPAALHRARRGKGSSADAAAVRAARNDKTGIPSDDAPESVADDEANRTKAPWHFWVLLVALAIYLSWRLIQGIVWVTHRF